MEEARRILEALDEYLDFQLTVLSELTDLYTSIRRDIVEALRELDM